MTLDRLLPEIRFLHLQDRNEGIPIPTWMLRIGGDDAGDAVYVRKQWLLIIIRKLQLTPLVTLCKVRKRTLGDDVGEGGGREIFSQISLGASPLRPGSN